MYAKKGKFGIGNRIDERAHQVGSLRNQEIIFSAKGHDPNFRFLACHPAHAVAVESGAVDHVFRGECSASCFDHHFRAARQHSLDLSSRSYGPALRGHNLCVFPADCGVICDAGTRHPHAQHAAAVRLNLAYLFRLQQAQSGKAIGLSTLEQHFQARDFAIGRGHNDFPADFMRQVVLAAKFHHGRGSFDAQPRLQRSGLVVNAGVNDSTVVSALMTGNSIFLLDHEQSQMRQGAGGVHRGRETYDTSTNDDDVERLIRHSGSGKPGHTIYTWHLYMAD